MVNCLVYFSDSRHSSMTIVKLSYIDMHKLCQHEYYEKCSPINNIEVIMIQYTEFYRKVLLIKL